VPLDLAGGAALHAGHGRQDLYDKIWDAHVVAEDPNGETILYVDLHLIHEVTSPQAFAGLRTAHRPVRRPDLTLAVADHNVPTEGQSKGVDAVADDEARLQLNTLARNVAEAGIEFFPMGDPRNGIVHIVVPNRAAPSRAWSSSAATATPRPTAPSGPWRTA